MLRIRCIDRKLKTAIDEFLPVKKRIEGIANLPDFIEKRVEHIENDFFRKLSVKSLRSGRIGSKTQKIVSDSEEFPTARFMVFIVYAAWKQTVRYQ